MQSRFIRFIPTQVITNLGFKWWKELRSGKQSPRLTHCTRRVSSPTSLRTTKVSRNESICRSLDASDLHVTPVFFLNFVFFWSRLHFTLCTSILYHERIRYKTVCRNLFLNTLVQNVQGKHRKKSEERHCRLQKSLIWRTWRLNRSIRYEWSFDDMNEISQTIRKSRTQNDSLSKFEIIHMNRLSFSRYRRLLDWW